MNNNNNNMMDLYTHTPSSPSLFTFLDEGLDFTLGAKCTPFLHPATTTTTTAAPTDNNYYNNNNSNVTTASYDLPEWMEGREIIGLPSDIHTDTLFPPATTTTTTAATTNIMESNLLLPFDESYCQTIKPEDMLVPLSEYQHPCTPASPATDAADDNTLPEANPNITTPVMSIKTSPANSSSGTNISFVPFSEYLEPCITPVSPVLDDDAATTPVKSIKTSPANSSSSTNISFVPFSEYLEPCITPVTPVLDDDAATTPVKSIKTSPANSSSGTNIFVPFSEYLKPCVTPVTPVLDDAAATTPVKSIKTSPANSSSSTNIFVPFSEYLKPCVTPVTPVLDDDAATTPVKSIRTSPAASIQSTHHANPIIITTTSSIPNVTYSAYPSPPHTPPNHITTTTPQPQPLPKIIICRKITATTKKPKPVTVQFQIKPGIKTQPKVIPKVSQATHNPGSVSVGEYREIRNQDEVSECVDSTGVSVVQYNRTHEYLDVGTGDYKEGLTAEDFIDDLVKMIGEENGELQGLGDLGNIPFDAKEMENCMEDLLTQLETTKPDERIEESHTVKSAASPCVPESEISSSSFESPRNALSPPPQTPQTTYPPGLLSPTPSTFTSPPSPTISETSTPFLPSPVPSVGSLSPSESGESFFSSVEEEEWSPLEETHSYSKSRKAKSSRRTAGRSRPYPEDRRERKKEQNKQAALRYRQKKKQEEDEMTEKIRYEEERQRELRGKYDGLKQELGYLKKMMREMFIARGLLTEEALKKAALERKTQKQQKRKK